MTSRPRIISTNIIGIEVISYLGNIECSPRLQLSKAIRINGCPKTKPRGDSAWWQRGILFDKNDEMNTGNGARLRIWVSPTD